MTSLKLRHDPAATPEPLLSALRLLAEEYPISGVGDAPSGSLSLEFLPGDPAVCRVRREGERVIISGGSTPARLRAVGAALSGLLGDGCERSEPAAFATFGVMIDCSRNAVMKPEMVKAWMRRMALLGFNQIQLYTEDTFEIEGEGYFGFLRGRYTGAEMRDLDAYAAGLGIEMVGCIQTLAHHEQILRWPAYREVLDFESTLLAGEEKTYALVGRMLDTMSGAIRSRRINIGMDEAWHLGRGAYLDRFGHRSRFEILNTHLQRVVGMCRERGLKPMIWSDMYFRIGSPKGDYYDPASVIPPEIAAAIPPDVQLAYWDYYHADKAFYADWIGRHRAIGFEPVMASGVWTWGQFWYNREKTEANAGACIDACRETGLKEIFFTMWGDDGAYCDMDSAWAGLAFVAERAHAPDMSALPARFASVCGGDYEATLLPSALADPVSAPALLWDDPILRIHRRLGLKEGGATWPEAEAHYGRLRDTLAPLAGSDSATGDLRHAWLIADFFARKTGLQRRIEDAYPARDATALGAVALEALEMASRIDALAASWRRQWMRLNKPEGFEVLQNRFAGQAARWRELSTRIDELLSGTVSAIPEWDEPLSEPVGYGWFHSHVASGSCDSWR